jgi:ketosteroid isomerase-like protein
MSEELAKLDPLRLTRRAYEQLNARDWAALTEAFEPEAVWDVSRWGLGTHRGHAGVRRFLEDWFGGLEEFEVQVEQLHDLGNGIVLAVVLQVAHQAGSSATLRIRSAPVFRWSAGRITAVTVYPDVAEGRAAAERAAEGGALGNIEVHAIMAQAVNERRLPVELLAPGFRLENHASAVTDYSYHDARGWREWISDLFEVFAPGAHYGVEEVIASGDDYVVASFLLAGRGARSAEPLEFRWAGVTWFLGGKAIRAVGYASRAEALEAVGLRSQAHG